MAGEVTIVAWPEQEDLRRWLAERRLHRMLLVEAEAPPPTPLDELEDWLRRPVRATDVAARAEELLRRTEAGATQRPVLDGDGLLRHDGRWVAIPEGQIDVMRILVERLGSVVTTEALREAYVAAGGSGHPSSMRTLIARLNRRVGEVGLGLASVRGRGVLLAARRDEPAR